MARLSRIPEDWMDDAAFRILRAVLNGGPRKRTVLTSLGGVAAGTEAFKLLLKHGALVTIGSKRGTVYGTPLQKRKPARKALSA